MENNTPAKKFTFKTFDRTVAKKQDFKEYRRGDVYVRSGEDNQFPNYLIGLYNRSSVHAAAVNATVEAIVGGGLTANMDWYLERANLRGETWNDIFAKVALDNYLFGSFALEIIWSRDRERIAEIYHIDFSHLRAKEKDYRGSIPGFYISADWDKKGAYAANIDDATYLPVFDPYTNDEEPSQIYVRESYRPGQEYYPLPVYNGALRVIELDTLVDEFHTNNIQNGMAPSLAITTFTNGDDMDVKAIETQLRANYGGVNNAGTVMYMDVDSRENMPEITPIPQNGADGYYVAVNDMTVQKILTAHRISSPTILGIATQGALGQRNEMMDAMVLWQTTVIAPYQQDILRCLEYILQFNHSDAVLGVETKTLFDDGTLEEEIITSVESTDGESADIQEAELSIVNENIKGLKGREFQALMRVVREYNKGKLSKDQAKQMLMSGYGLSEVEVNVWLGEDEEQINPI